MMHTYRIVLENQLKKESMRAIFFIRVMYFMIAKLIQHIKIVYIIQEFQNMRELFIVMAISMKDSSRRVPNMDEENLSGKMALFMMDNIAGMRNMEQVHYLLTVNNIEINNSSMDK